MALWLAFDAGSPGTSAAVARDGVLVAESTGASRTGPSLLQHVDAVVRQAAVALNDLDGIAVLRGPGSFTGIRVALSTAVGMRAALEVPVFALSNLAGLALHGGQEEGARILALVDALRDEWFAQTFRRVGTRLVAQDGPERFPASAIVPPPGTVVAAHLGQPLPGHLAGLAVRPVPTLAASVAQAAAGGILEELLSAELDPLYLRAFTPRSPQR